eukprot:gene52370-biopygen42145
MDSFELRWRASTKKDLRQLPPQEVARIVEAVTALGAQPFPHGSQKLAGSDLTYRIRIGDYRVVYEVVAELRLVEVQRVCHRKDVYR